MAFAGACIVFSGLVVLSLVISQLRKIVELIEKKPDVKKATKTAIRDEKEAVKPKIIAPPPEKPDLNFAAMEGVYKPLTTDLEQPFQLAGLYAAAEEKGLPHPHLSIKHLRESGILTPAGDGAFTWASDN